MIRGRNKHRRQPIITEGWYLKRCLCVCTTRGTMDLQFNTLVHAPGGDVISQIYFAHAYYVPYFATCICIILCYVRFLQMYLVLGQQTLVSTTWNPAALHDACSCGVRLACVEHDLALILKFNGHERLRLCQVRVFARTSNARGGMRRSPNGFTNSIRYCSALRDGGGTKNSSTSL